MAPAVLTHDSNEHEWSARWKKAHDLASILHAEGYPSSEVDFITEAAWEAVAADATKRLGHKVNPPNSQDTIDCVFDCLRKLENSHGVVESVLKKFEGD